MLRARDPTSGPKTGRHRAGRTSHTLPVSPVGGRCPLGLKSWAYKAPLVGGRVGKKLRAGVRYGVTRVSRMSHHAYMHYETSALAQTLERNVFLDAEQRFARVIRRPAPKLGGTGQGALRTPARRPLPLHRAGSVDGVVEVVHRLAGRVLGVCGRFDEDLSDGAGGVVQACPSLRYGSGEITPRHSVSDAGLGFHSGELRSPSSGCRRAPESCQHAVDEGVLAVSLPESCFTGCVVDECQPAVRQSFGQGEGLCVT